MELTYDAFLSAVKRHLVATQRTFNKLPSASNWNALTAAMFVFQQIEYATANENTLRYRGDVMKACEGKPFSEMADAISMAIYGEPWADLQKEFFVA